MKCAQPVSVSYCKEVMDDAGHYVGATSVIVDVIGNCCPRAFLGGNPAVPPCAWGGDIFHINYISDTDISVIEYRFVNGWFKNRFRTSERFRQKMIQKINGKKISDYKQQIEQETR